MSDMADLVISNVPARTLAALEDRAKLHGRSVEAEAYAILMSAARPTGRELVAWLKTIRPAIGDPDAGIGEIRASRDER